MRSSIRSYTGKAHSQKLGEEMRRKKGVNRARYSRDKGFSPLASFYN